MFYLNRKGNNLRDIFNDNFLDDVFNLPTMRKNYLKSDLIENEKEYNLTVEIPGLEKEDIKIAYEDSYLKISAEKKQSVDKSDESKNYVHKEIYYGSYSRSFYLENIDKENIKASLNNGILNVILPKKEQDNTKKFINIE
ncbi:MAG: Hsp20/alpha crystallin family protein [Bacilli bacterium]|nr:Hsp20/alpha crystallin family protein [Bacilli bacterium]